MFNLHRDELDDHQFAEDSLDPYQQVGFQIKELAYGNQRTMFSMKKLRENIKNDCNDDRILEEYREVLCKLADRPPGYLGVSHRKTISEDLKNVLIRLIGEDVISIRRSE